MHPFACLAALRSPPRRDGPVLTRQPSIAFRPSGARPSRREASGLAFSRDGYREHPAVLALHGAASALDANLHGWGGDRSRAWQLRCRGTGLLERSTAQPYIEAMRRAVLVLALLLTACAAPASRVNAPDPHRFTELVPGVSTVADATVKLGPSNSFFALAHGQTLLQWIDVYASNPIHVAILFGADGRMIRVQHVFEQ